MDEKAARVRDMFGTIARRYDLLNHLLSFGIDRGWRRQAVRAALEHSPSHILDVATGTADLALALKRAAPQAQVVGMDFTEEMLVIGRDKAARAGLSVALLPGDGQALDYPDGSFDSVTIAYGLRNFSDPAKGLAEFWRVLRPGGRLVVLEFPPPPGGVFGRLFRLYFLRILPLVAGAVSGNRRAYRYLGDSVLNFPAPEVLADMMRQAGFASVRYRLQTFGVSALHCGDKPLGDARDADRDNDGAGDESREPRETDAHRL